MIRKIPLAVVCLNALGVPSVAAVECHGPVARNETRGRIALRVIPIENQVRRLAGPIESKRETAEHETMEPMPTPAPATRKPAAEEHDSTESPTTEQVSARIAS